MHGLDTPDVVRPHTVGRGQAAPDTETRLARIRSPETRLVSDTVARFETEEKSMQVKRCPNRVKFSSFETAKTLSMRCLKSVVCP